MGIWNQGINKCLLRKGNIKSEKDNQSTVIFFYILNFTVKENKVKNNCIFIVT